MAQKTRHEIEIDINNLRQHIEDSIPKFISPNGGSLEEVQRELVEIYQLILLVVESLKDSVWEKT